MADMYMRTISDWRDATLMLSFEEKGYFDEILNLIYTYDDLLPDDDDLICRAMPVHKVTHKRLKKALIKNGLIEIRNGFYFNKRAAKEIAKINQLSEKNKIKAQKRWVKSLKNRKNNAAAADAPAMLKVNSESESEDKNNAIGEIGQKRNKNDKSKKPPTTKCTIDAVLDPDGEIPEVYRRFAEEKGLENPQRAFEDWAGWWVGENGRKAGGRGWMETWKARVRKDVDRQMAALSRNPGRGGHSTCATTEGARLALDRRRNCRRKV